MTQHIPATPTELQKLAQRITEANLASERATELFTMFCEARGLSGASFVSLDEGGVTVSLPNAAGGA